ncbi:MAG: alpha/beta hydrolase, partial [Allorhizobium sp.]
MRIVMGLLLALVFLSIAAIVFLYLRPPVLALEREAKTGADTPLDSLEALIADGETAAGKIREGLAKQIVWADPIRKAKAPVSVVYVHGFSA